MDTYFVLTTMLCSMSAKNMINYQNPRCLKITVKVSFNIASEASYVYILSGQMLIKNAKNGPIWRVFENLKLAIEQCYQTGHFLLGQKLVENTKIKEFKCDIFSNFHTMWERENLEKMANCVR